MNIKKLANLRFLQKAVAIVWSCSRILFLLRISISLIQSILPLITVYLMKLIIDAVTQPSTQIWEMHSSLFYVLLSGVVLLLQYGLTSLSAYLSEMQQLMVHDHIADKLHRQSIRVDLEFYENPKYYDTLHRAQQVAIDKPFQSFNNALLLVQNGLSFLAMAQVLTTFHWSIVFALLAIVLPGIFYKIKFSQQTFHWDRKRTLTNRRTFYYNWLLTSDWFAKEIRLFKLGRLFIKRYHNLRAKLRQEKLAISKRKNLADFNTQSLTVIAVYGTLAIMAQQAVTGKISVGDLVMYFTAFQRGLGFIKNLLTNAAGLYDDSLYLSNLFDFLALEPKIQSEHVGLPIQNLAHHTITFEHVTFQYPHEERYVLDDISFQVQPGEHIALVGENGAGKSTIIKLLCRLYDPTGGHIFVGDVALPDIHLDDWQQNISVVFQDFGHFNMRVRDNIWFGNLQMDENSPFINQAAEFSGADEVIERLPKKYETVLGKMWEDGTEISIGEWQKIALSRAILRNADVIVLDEPTAALDARAEFEVFQHFKKLAAGKTAFLISHRLGSARLADRILVLKNGKIVEQGSHQQLLEKNGYYAEMYGIQSKFYQD